MTGPNRCMLLMILAPFLEINLACCLKTILDWRNLMARARYFTFKLRNSFLYGVQSFILILTWSWHLKLVAQITAGKFQLPWFRLLHLSFYLLIPQMTKELVSAYGLKLRLRDILILNRNLSSQFSVILKLKESLLIAKQRWYSWLLNKLSS